MNFLQESVQPQSAKRSLRCYQSQIYKTLLRYANLQKSCYYDYLVALSGKLYDNHHKYKHLPCNLQEAYS